MANRIKKQMKQQSNKNGMFALIMGTFALSVLCLLPLVYHDYYFDILETKYQTYCVFTIAMIVAMTLYGLMSGCIKRCVSNLNIKEMIRGLTLPDWAMLAFWLCNVVSWVCSPWRWEAFWGTSGRYNGVFLMTIYMVVYFLVTRCFVFRKWYLDVFLAVGLLVSLFGITDYFQMDIFGFKVRMVDYQRAIYTSTFGNINTYTIYVAALMVVSMLLFAHETNKRKMLWYYGNMVIASFALIMGCSDNAYLSLAALFGLSPLYLFRTKTGTCRYLISLATFFTVIWCIDGINAVFAESVIEIDSAFTIVAGLKMLPLVVVGLWGIVIASNRLLLKKNGEQDSNQMGKWLFWLWIGVIAVVVSAAAFGFYDATVAGHAERYGALAPYVTFNDSWGTNRGYVWRCSVELWREVLTPFQKLFGYGADTFLILMRMHYETKVSHGRNIAFDSAHNEYLHYLITIGLAGMLSYMLFLASSVWTMCKRLKNRPEVAAVMFVTIAYAVQATVNINLPIAMPIILQLLAMGLSKVPEEA